MSFKPVDPQVNFPELEKKRLKHWYESGIVEKYLHKNDQSAKSFSFMDGPITANNPMGVHHAWGRTYKDLWPRFWNMRGYKQRFQNGFDCQGLWVEVEVEKELGLKSKKDIENLVPEDKKASIAKFIDLCKQRVLKYAAIQTEQSKRLGYFADWDHSYFTMSEANNYMIWHFLKRCHQKGYLYKGEDVVPWCPRCETAISQHETLTEDYKEVVHKSIYVKLKIVDRPNESLLIWTTTPWTIPANTAVAADKDIKYALVKISETESVWLAKDRVAKILGKEVQITKTAPGKTLAGLAYQAPYDHQPYVKGLTPEQKQKFHRVYLTDPLIMPISVEEGTGLVHTSTSTGQEDYQLGKQLGLPVVPATDDIGQYLPDFGELEGKNAKKHPEVVIDYLQANNWLYKVEQYRHRYPVCWRCKTELIWKVADEWYIAMDRQDPEGKKGRTLRKQMVAVAKKITWMPEFGLKRELDWLKNMHDWLISKKNRYWGLALPIWECAKCGHFEVMGGKEELKTRAIEGWDKFAGHTPHRPYIDEVKIKCEQCGQLMSRILDVGNPWLDAGIVPYSTIIEKPQKHKLDNITAKNIKIEHGQPLYLSDKQAWEQWFPADFITESFPGQFKNWFYSMIAMSTVLENREPYQRVLGFGTLLGEDGRPMHKSWGNAIEFNQGADELGVDVMRFMFALQNPADNLLFGPKGAALVKRKVHLLLWNIYNFFVTYANTDSWQPSSADQNTDLSHWYKKQLKKVKILDQWIIVRQLQLIKVVSDALSKYDAMSAAQALQEFINDFSTWYVRRSRTRLGPTASDQDDKQVCYQTLYHVLVTLSKLLAPITPFLADEIYANLTGEESVHLADWPSLGVKLSKDDLALLDSMNKARWIVERGHAARKETGLNVRQPLQKLRVKVSWKLPSQFQELIKEELNIKEIFWNSSGTPDSYHIGLDTKLTPSLRAEGQARELIRKIQIARKEAGCELTEKVTVTLPDWPQEFEEEIKRQTLAQHLIQGDSLQINRKSR